jgi:hypothetical protein
MTASELETPSRQRYCNATTLTLNGACSSEIVGGKLKKNKNNNNNGKYQRKRYASVQMSRALNVNVNNNNK